MPSNGTHKFIMFRASETGPDLEAAVAAVRASAGLRLLKHGRSALLVEGDLDTVERLAASLAGWAYEFNQPIYAA